MKQIKTILAFAVILSSVLFFSSCEEEKDDIEKRRNIEFNYTYNENFLTVSVHNKNTEGVTVKLFGSYRIFNPNTDQNSTLPEYVNDKLKMSAGEKIIKDYPLNGDMPVGLNVQFTVN